MERTLSKERSNQHIGTKRKAIGVVSPVEALGNGTMETMETKRPRTTSLVEKSRDGISATVLYRVKGGIRRRANIIKKVAETPIKDRVAETLELAVSDNLDIKFSAIEGEGWAEEGAEWSPSFSFSFGKPSIPPSPFVVVGVPLDSFIFWHLLPIVDGPKLITFYLKSIRPKKLIETIGTESRIAIGRRRVTFNIIWARDWRSIFAPKNRFEAIPILQITIHIYN